MGIKQNPGGKHLSWSPFLKKPARQRQAGRNASEKGTHLFGLCACAYSPGSGSRDLDSFLVTAPEFLAGNWAQDVSTGSDTWFFPGKQALQALLWLLRLPCTSQLFPFSAPPGKPNLPRPGLLHLSGFGAQSCLSLAPDRLFQGTARQCHPSQTLRRNCVRNNHLSLQIFPSCRAPYACS